MQRALVVGAGGAVGEAVTHALLGRGWQVVAGVRTHRPGVAARLQAAGAKCAPLDLNTENWSDVAADCAAVVFTTHLSLTVRALTQWRHSNARVIAFSSNNVATHPEAPTYSELAGAERALFAQLPDAIVLRPTLIYGDPRLRTLSRLLRMSRYLPVLPLPGAGRARVQPVFHGDLGIAAAGLAELGEAGGVYALGGPDVVSMRELYEAIIRTTRSRARILTIPSGLLAALSRVAPLGYAPEQAARADRDRIAVVQTSLPPDLTPKTHLGDGLALHWQALLAERWG